MEPYSLDLRQRVVAAVEDGDGTIAEVAAMFRVGKTFVKKMLRVWRESGTVAPQPHGGGAPAALASQQLQALRQQVAQEPDASLAELRHFLHETEGVAVSEATVCRALQRLGLPRKKRALPVGSATRTSGPGIGGGSRSARWSA
jgi:transposase